MKRKKPVQRRTIQKLDVGTKLVPDPFEPGAMIEVACNTRESPIEHMRARDKLDGAQYAAGERYRQIYEAAQLGPLRGIDPMKEAVDGGRMPQPMNDHMRQAMRQLTAAHEAVGRGGAGILMTIVGEGVSIAVVAQHYPRLAHKMAEGYVAGRVREALDDLVALWGMISEPSARQQVRGSGPITVTGPSVEWEAGRFGDAVATYKRGAERQ